MAKARKTTVLMDEEPGFLYVRSARDDNRVALHEVDEAHPGGSVLVAGDAVRKVGDTPYVRAQIRERQLEEVNDAEGKAEADNWLKEREKAFVEAGMMAPAAVVGDVIHVNEGIDFDAEAEMHGHLGRGGDVDPTRPGVGSLPTREEEAGQSEDKDPSNERVEVRDEKAHEGKTSAGRAPSTEQAQG